MKRSKKVVVSLVSSTLFSSQTLLMLPPAQAQTFEGFEGCPVGTKESAVNFVTNGDFATNAGTGNGLYTPPGPVPPGLSFNSDLPYRGDSVYPNDPIGGLSIQGGPYPISYFGGIVRADPFPGDPANGVAPSNSFLYSNPSERVGGGSAFPNPVIWQQVVTGLAPDTSYTFSAYFYNLLDLTAPGDPPIIRFLAGPPGGAPGSFVPTLAGLPVGNGTALPGVSASQNIRQRWIRVQGVFRTSPGQTALELRIEDEANTIFGDDFGMTAVGLRECVPILGVAKTAGQSTQNSDGTYTIPYTLTVRNYAPTGSFQYDLSDFRLTDDLATAFAGATVNSVTNIQSPTLAVNAGFNGSTDQNLLASGNTLPAGATATVTFDVIVTPGNGSNGFGPFNNTTIASGTSRGGTNVSDRSTDGTNPDPDSNGNPGDNDVPTSVTLTPGGGNSGGNGGGASSLRLVKRVTNVLRGGASLGSINFNTFQDAPGGDDNAPGWAQLTPQGAPLGVFTIGSNTPLLSGDEIEYTIYFLADGNAPAISVSLCDAIPSGTGFISGSTQVKRGSASPIPGGSYFSPLAPLPSGNACQNQTNPNGSVIFDLGDIPTTSGDNVGFARFRVRVE